jgi:predicted murein hydrolase (TIGR00659 family)
MTPPSQFQTYFAIGLTLVAFVLAVNVYERNGKTPWLNPLMVSIGLVAMVISLLGIDVKTYRQGTAVFDLLLGPAVISLAIPIREHLQQIKRGLEMVLCAIAIGSVAAIFSALTIAVMFHASHALAMSLAPKSVTSPVAILISEKLGGIANLSAVFVIITGMIGAVLGKHIFRFVDVECEKAQGLAYGTSSHILGTVEAFTKSQACGVYSAFAMGANAVLTAILLPLILVRFSL